MPGPIALQPEGNTSNAQAVPVARFYPPLTKGGGYGF